MKRNLDLIRMILMALESMPYSSVEKMNELNLEGFSDDELLYHIELMVESKMITAKFYPQNGRNIFCCNVKLTGHGHDALDLIRNDNKWVLIKNKASEFLEKTLSETLIAAAKSLLT